MNRWASLVLLALFGTALTPPAGAQNFGQESLKIRDVIEAQWQAFLDDDAEKAFSLASPSVQETFGTPENFMTTVRNDYPMVYRHVASEFLDQELHPGFSFQLVSLSLQDGEVWLVVYQMQQKSDGSWCIGGVVAVPRSEVPETGGPSDAT